MKIDAKGLICPEPIMLLHRAIHEASSGDVIELVATDPTAEKDVEKFCEYLNHELVSKKISDGLLEFKVKKIT
jgi:tRNA 2-thiouridine synthesizing protein A